MATINAKPDNDAKINKEEAPKGEAASASTGKKRGKFFPKASKGSENAAAGPLPPRAPDAVGPRPTKLSTTATKPRNEPMFSDIDMMGFPGVAPYRRTNEFAITAEGFIPLCEREYDVIAANQPYFVKTVSKSAFVYFCVMSLYARLISLKQEEGDSTYNEDSFAGQVLSGNHQLPVPIEAYIKALGHIVDSSSIRYKLRMPAWPNEAGTFGVVDASTHWKYMSMPCPLICKQRIQEDMRFTNTPGVRDWQLPDSIKTREEGAGTPTRNCLGWARAAGLTNDQMAFLESANVMEDSFPVKFAQFQYSTDLYEKVSLALSKIEEKIKILPQTKKSVEGAIAQVCWIQVEPGTEDVSPNTFYCEARNNQVITSSELDARQVLASLILAFRVKKDEFQAERHKLRPYCIYNFSKYTNVPDAWHATANTVFGYGRADRWNVKEYTAPFTDKSEYRLAWLKRHVK